MYESMCKFSDFEKSAMRNRLHNWPRSIGRVPRKIQYVKGGHMDGGSETRLRRPRYIYPFSLVLWDRCEGYQDETSITLPQLCQNYMTLCVRIGKIEGSAHRC